MDDLTDYERFEYVIKAAFRKTYSPELLQFLEQESGTYITEQLYAAFAHGFIEGINDDN